MGSSTGSASSSKGEMQKKQGQEEANAVLKDLGYTIKDQNVYSDKGQVAGAGWSGSRAVDAVRDAGYQVGLKPGGLGTSGSPLEIQQIAAITGRTPEEVEKERMMVSEVYGRDPKLSLGIDKFGNPRGYVATAPTLSELGGDIKRAILGGTYGSVMRGEPAPENYQGIVAPLANLAMPGGFIRTMIPNIYQEGKEFVGQPVDYIKNLFSGIFSPSATNAVEMNPTMRNYLNTFNNRSNAGNSDRPIENTLEKMPTMETEFEEETLPFEPLDASNQAQIIYPYGNGSTLVSYQDIINPRV